MVISFTVVLKLAIAVSIGLFQTFCLIWLQFFSVISKTVLVYDQKV